MDFVAAGAGRDNLTTAREMCILLSGLLDPDQPYGALVDWLKQARGDGKLVAGVPAGTVVAHKVGDLPGATFVEHDAGIVYAPNGPYVVAQLSANLPEPEIGKATIAQASRLIYRQMVGSSNVPRA